MEERILDEDESRGIRLKRTQDGEVDAVEETEGEEVTLEFPDGEYDEDLVGLTPSQLKEELEKRQKAREEALAESKKLTEQGNALFAEGDYTGAAPLYSQAALYDPDNEEAACGLFAALTENFTTTEPLYTPQCEADLARLPAGRQAVVERLGETLRGEQKAYEEEEKTLSADFDEKQSRRREAFAANRKHYIILTGVALFALAALVIATAISADNILRTQSTLPIVLTAVFGGLAFVALAVTAVFGTKLSGACRLCAVNEKLSSTDEGKRLIFLRGRLETLALILSEE